MGRGSCSAIRIATIRLGEVGRCIYCGTYEQLTDEHLIPYGLNGPWVLPKASCKRCGAITSAFEMTVLRESLIAARTVLGRSYRSLPTHLPLQIKQRSRWCNKKVPITQHFIAMILPVYRTPVYLEEREYTSGIEVVEFNGYQVGGSPVSTLGSQHKTKIIRVSTTWHGTDFARLLAKAAYGFAVAQYGLDAFEEKYVVPAILGQSEDIGRWVGSAPDRTILAGDNVHVVQVGTIGSDVLVRMKLFSLFDTPEYLIVVGRLRPEKT